MSNRRKALAFFFLPGTGNGLTLRLLMLGTWFYENTEVHCISAVHLPEMTSDMMVLRWYFISALSFPLVACTRDLAVFTSSFLIPTDHKINIKTLYRYSLIMVKVNKAMEQSISGR